MHVVGLSWPPKEQANWLFIWTTEDVNLIIYNGGGQNRRGSCRLCGVKRKKEKMFVKQRHKRQLELIQLVAVAGFRGSRPYRY